MVPSRPRGTMDCAAYLMVGAAAADVGHRRVDLVVARLRRVPEQRHRRHDLAGLAVAALRRLRVDPGLLHRVQAPVDPRAPRWS